MQNFLCIPFLWVLWGSHRPISSASHVSLNGSQISSTLNAPLSLASATEAPGAPGEGVAHYPSQYLQLRNTTQHWPDFSSLTTHLQVQQYSQLFSHLVFHISPAWLKLLYDLSLAWGHWHYSMMEEAVAKIWAQRSEAGEMGWFPVSAVWPPVSHPSHRDQMLHVV